MLAVACLRSSGPVALLRIGTKMPMRAFTCCGAAYAAWGAICLGYSLLLANLSSRRRKGGEGLQLGPMRSFEASEFTFNLLQEHVLLGEPFVVRGLDALPALAGKMGLRAFEEHFGSVRISVQNTNSSVSNYAGFCKAPLSDFISFIEQKAAAGEQCNARLHGFAVPAGEERTYEQPAAVYDCLRPSHGIVRRGASHYYVGSQGALVYLHWDPEYNHNLHMVLAGRKRVLLYTADQSRCLYQMPSMGKMSAVGSSLGDVDHTLFPALRSACGYETELSAGDLVYMPSMCWHYMEYLQPSIAQTCAFWPSRLEWCVAQLQAGICDHLFGSRFVPNVSVAISAMLTPAPWREFVSSAMRVACLRATFPECRMTDEFFCEYLRLEWNRALRRAV